MWAGLVPPRPRPSVCRLRPPSPQVLMLSPVPACALTSSCYSNTVLGGWGQGHLLTSFS